MAIDLDAVLAHLTVQQAAPTAAYLDALLLAWCKTIPWESISRMARHRHDNTPENYVWWPDIFFENSLTRGTGGTCFESNYALKALLDALGFAVTLHFCDMESSRGDNPHSALIVWMDDGQEYLADVGYPIPGALKLIPGKTTSVQTPAYIYQAVWIADRRWAIDRISGSFEQRSFILKSDAIPVEDFQKRMIRDHAPDGLFLDQAIILKVIDDHTILRWSSNLGLMRRAPGLEETVILNDRQQVALPDTLSELFGMDTEIIAAVLSRVK